MIECKHLNCGGDGYWRDGPWGNGVPCDCFPEHYPEEAANTKARKDFTEELKTLNEALERGREERDLSTDEFVEDCKPGIGPLSSQQLAFVENLMKPQLLTFKQKIRNVMSVAKNWLVEKEREIVDKISIKTKIRFRKQFYRYRYEVRTVGGVSSTLQIIFHLEPNWIGRKLGYIKDRKGYYKSCGEWVRIFGQRHEGSISPDFSKHLDLIAARDRLIKNRI